MTLDPTFLLALAGFITALATLANAWWSRRKLKAEADHISAQAGEAAAQSVSLLLGPLNDKIRNLTEELTSAKTTIANMAQERQNDLVIVAREREERDRQRRKLQSEITELRGGVAVLVAQLEEAGIIPRYHPQPGEVNSGKP